MPSSFLPRWLLLAAPEPLRPLRPLLPLLPLPLRLPGDMGGLPGVDLCFLGPLSAAAAASLQHAHIDRHEGRTPDDSHRRLVENAQKNGKSDPRRVHFLAACTRFAICDELNHTSGPIPQALGSKRPTKVPPVTPRVNGIAHQQLGPLIMILIKIPSTEISTEISSTEISIKNHPKPKSPHTLSRKCPK